MKAFVLGLLHGRMLSNPIIQGRAKELYAEAEGVRYDVFFTRVAFVLSLLAGAGSVGALLITIACLIPGRTGVILAAFGGSVAAVSGAAAALGPKMTKAAGICTLAREQKRPLWPTLKDILALLADAPKIVRDAKAKAEADALQAERDRAARLAEINRAALVTDIAKQAVILIERSKSFKQTPEGLVEDGILAEAPTMPAEVTPIVDEVATAAKVAPETSALASEVAPLIADAEQAVTTAEKSDAVATEAQAVATELKDAGDGVEGKS